MAINKLELSDRLARIREKMHEENFNALIIYSDEYRSGNTSYFTDYKPINVIEESPQVIFVVEDADPVVMIGRLNSFAAKETIWIDDVRPIHEIDEHLDFIFKPIKSKNPKIGIIGDNLLPVKTFNSIKNNLPEAKFVSCGEMLSEIRAIKSPAEIELMRKAPSINDYVHSKIVNK